MAALFDQPSNSPEGVSTDAVKGAPQRYARGWKAETSGRRDDLAEAAYWYALAAHDGSPQAMINLGRMIIHGQAPGNFLAADAVLMWRTAGMLGEAIGFYNL